jgi:hypothetical protein
VPISRPVHEDVFEALRTAEDRPEPELASTLLRSSMFTIVPLAVAIIAAMVHRDYGALIWPPSPVLLLAPAIAYLAMRRVSTSDVELWATVVFSALAALFAAWVVALVLGFFAAVECVAPGGGCIPW